ncbi:MAG: hypothetical protein D4R88_07950 [Methanosarcinales archaeon]|jgi:Arc/MetJ-type ribon-helix-helix transcriptional regulator|nr:MAG: hypothetical protein D4R88_07950 [Methanosarcinales archaeon]
MRADSSHTMEEEAIDNMIKAGLFANKEEVVRTAVIKYAVDIGLLKPQHLWNEIEKYKRRKITPEQLQQDLEMIENET